MDQLITAAESWPAERSADDWPTFAGRNQSDQDGAATLGPGAGGLGADHVGGPLRRGRVELAHVSLRRIGEDAQRLLSYHPVVAEHLVLFNNQTQIFAFDTQHRPGRLAREGQTRTARFSRTNGADRRGADARGLGVPRFTITVHDGKLFAADGLASHQSAARVARRPQRRYLVCLDLAAEGRLVWTIPEAATSRRVDRRKWAFEGSPLVDGSGRLRRHAQKATCGRKHTWPASTPRPAGAAGGR